ncbi:hypothetical protein [Undibacterium terreum]|uniref:Lipoprotein SmpA/OmlA domain-containing protein n=1 Tax=Undibacterium terreum TaxID=1224302 RepID=A0A916UUJ5_9BURK|nr:hypothetical protein [Undibacterium terreum]GGC89180.1 hypothetical protein GCM10011396_40480 [Undibacterium terreum]
MKRVWTHVAPLVCAAALAACATTPKGEIVDAEVARVSVPLALSSIVSGTSTRADVMAALGRTKTIRFDSGFEIWLYYQDGQSGRQVPADEFVVLFAPSGVVAKTRVRPSAPALGNLTK